MLCIYNALDRKRESFDHDFFNPFELHCTHVVRCASSLLVTYTGVDDFGDDACVLYFALDHARERRRPDYVIYVILLRDDVPRIYRTFCFLSFAPQDWGSRALAESESLQASDLLDI